MNILISTFYRAPQGGLHENVRATLKLLVKQGHKCTLLCPAGAFAEEMRSLDVTIVTTDFSDVGNSKAFHTLNDFHTESRFNVVHTHPFYSRKVAQRLAAEWQVPLITTIHGRYTDELEVNFRDFSTIFAVSEGIRDYLIEQVGPELASRIIVAPNGVELSRFPKPCWLWEEKRIDLLETPTIALVSRFDKDKQFILHTFLSSVRELVKRKAKFKLLLVGAGNQENQLVEKLTDLLPNGIDARGWLSGNALVRAYSEADIVVAPGRCALEAMASGKPTVAIGSKGYVGLITNSNWQEGVYSNFGGIGNQETDYPEHALANDIELLVQAPQQRLKLGKLGRQIIELFYDEDIINQKVIGIYQMLATRESQCLKPLSGKVAERRDADTLRLDGKIPESTRTFVFQLVGAIGKRVSGDSRLAAELGFKYAEDASVKLVDLRQLDANYAERVGKSIGTLSEKSTVIVLSNASKGSLAAIISQVDKPLVVEVVSEKHGVALLSYSKQCRSTC